MNSIRETGYIICVVLVVTGIFSMLLPSGNTVKSVKFAIHLFLIISVVSPVFNVNADFYKMSYRYDITENETYTNLNELYNDGIIKSFKNELIIITEAIFEKYGIIPEKIEILTNVNRNQSIDITKVNITLKASYKNKCDKAYEEIKDLFMVTPTLIFEGEQDG